MPTPKNFVCASLFVCENTLVEADDTISAIRIVDVFSYTPIPGIPVENSHISMRVVGLIKLDDPDLRDKRTLRLDLVRPNGDRSTGETFEYLLAPNKFPDAYYALTFNVQANVVTLQPGGHWWILCLDDEEVARCPVTLTLRQAPNTQR